VGTHGGNVGRLAESAGLKPDELLDFSASINPLGPPDWLRAVVSAHLAEVARYPDPECTELVAAISARYDVPGDRIVVGNGSAEIIAALPRVLDAQRALIPVPSYTDYALAAGQAGLVVESLPLDPAQGFVPDLDRLESGLEGGEIVFLGHPNNPTGTLWPPEDLESVISRHPRSWFVVDEAFIEFVSEAGGSTRAASPLGRARGTLLGANLPNLVVLRSMTKMFAIPGLRLGFAVAPRETASVLRGAMVPWSVNCLAQAVGVVALADREYPSATRSFVACERQRLAAELATLPELRVYPGTANYLLARLIDAPVDAPGLSRRLLQRRIAIRVCDDFGGLDRSYFRVAVRSCADDDHLVAELRDMLKSPLFPRPGSGAADGRDRVPAVMFQGTASNVGKSILAAAFCRILLEDGHRVAPFKAQNMSLNSSVTTDGGEIGRAQALQAQACRLDPDVRMNPVLLKPSSSAGVQVIVWGKPVGTMSTSEYQAYTGEARHHALRAYDSLSAEFEVMVLEGAGSPAEVNLRKTDIVNMGMAAHARAPVVVVGDIDRGGVFAALVGTMELLGEAERRLVAGFVLNKFRGDPSLLEAASRRTTLHTGVPILGVVPFLPNLGLPDEDSVSFKDSAGRAEVVTGDSIRIALVDLPHISNVSDFDPLRLEPDVVMETVRSAEDLRRRTAHSRKPDVLILPGSKNTRADLAYLRGTGLAAEIETLSQSGGTEIVGVCGGYQMLGRAIVDPLGVESAGSAAEGLRLLPLDTVMAEEKTLRRVRGCHLVSGMEIRGYEIHHGRSASEEGAARAVAVDLKGEVLGLGDPRGLVWGTYLHGLFDANEFRRWFVDRARVRRGLGPLGRVVASYDLEPAIEALARTVRESVDVKAVYGRMGLV
jgi:adenosylcobyric acid synthase